MENNILLENATEVVEEVLTNDAAEVILETSSKGGFLKGIAKGGVAVIAIAGAGYLAKTLWDKHKAKKAEQDVVDVECTESDFVDEDIDSEE